MQDSLGSGYGMGVVCFLETGVLCFVAALMFLRNDRVDTYEVVACVIRVL